MILNQLTYYHFKVLNHDTLEFNSHINFIFGNNGFGKTSFLEAIHFLFTARSFYKISDQELLQYNKDFFKLEGSLTKSTGRYHIQAHYNHIDKKKRYLIDSKKVPQYYTLLSSFPLVYSTPFDIEILRGSPLERRKFFDRTISYQNKDYYENLKKYHKLIKEKNVLLKNQDTQMLDIWNQQIIDLGSIIIEQRLSYIESLNGMIKDHKLHFNSLKEGLEVLYKGPKSKEELEKLIKQNTSQEIKRRMALYGPHRDDFIFYAKKEQKLIKDKLSLGQTKILAFYLKTLELLLLNQILKEKPIFLVDEVFSELDNINKNKVMEILNSLPNQIFVTTTKDNIYFYDKPFVGILIDSPGNIKK